MIDLKKLMAENTWTHEHIVKYARELIDEAEQAIQQKIINSPMQNEYSYSPSIKFGLVSKFDAIALECIRVCASNESQLNVRVESLDIIESDDYIYFWISRGE